MYPENPHFLNGADVDALYDIPDLGDESRLVLLP